MYNFFDKCNCNYYDHDNEHCSQTILSKLGRRS